MAVRRKRFVVIGLGHFGSWTARVLHERGHEVIAVERDPDLVDRTAPFVTRAVVGDATDSDLLREIGADTADVAVITTGDDLAVTVLATQALKGFGVKEVYVKVTSPEAAKAMEAFGVTDTIFPEREVASRLAHSIGSQAVFDYLPLADGYSLQQIAIPDAWLGKTLRELGLPKRHGINVVAIFDVLADKLIPVPDPDVPLKDSDLAIVVGRDETVTRVLKTG